MAVDAKGAAWPPFSARGAWIEWPVLPDPRTAILSSLLAQIEQSQWYATDELSRLQGRQLEKLIAYARQHSLYYRQCLPEQAGMDQLQALPLLSRSVLQQEIDSIHAAVIPREHGGYTETKSSGSTGRMVTVRRTEACMMFWLALTLREHLWHRRDFSRSLAVIRPNVAESDTDRRGVDLPDWGVPVNLLFTTGTAHALSLQTDVARQARWLEKLDPVYLLTFPTNLEALITYFRSSGIQLPSLREIRTVGETLSEALRTQARDFFGVGITDTYSSQELGVIALQCPDSALYHVMAENLIVEVLREDDSPCGPGEVGRVVVTDLHNFATPLIRYDTRDYAEVGLPCPCGRGLPTLTRIAGRSRNMLVFPDGRRFWPLVGAYRFRDVAPISQYQLIQTRIDTLEVRLVAQRPITPSEEAALAGLIHASLGYPFILQFRYFELEIPRGAGGKFEEFMCMLDDGT